MNDFCVIIEDLTGAQLIGVSKELAERDAVNGEYRFTFGIHTLRIILASRPRAVAEESDALPAVL